MEYQIFLILAPFSIGILLVTGIFIYRRRQNRLAKILMLYFIFVTGYLLSNISELLLSTPKATLNAAKVGHFFFSFIPVLWFRFALKYTGKIKNQTNWKFLLVYLIPVLTNIFIYTNPLHHLIWGQITFFQIKGYLTMRAVYGPWMWFTGVYNDGLYLIGMSLIFQSALGAMKTYRNQSLLISAGALIPLVFNALYAFHLLPFLRKDFTSISFTVTAICSFIGITRFQLFRIVPVARNRIVQDLSTAILVIDSERKFVDFNQAAADLLKLSESSLGREIDRHFSMKRFLLALEDKNGEWMSVGELETKGRIYKIHWKSISIGPDEPDGILLTITDKTDETLLLREKTALADNLKKSNDELQAAQGIIIQQEKLATIGQLTAGIAHEMSNPLSFVRSNFHTLEHYWNRFKEISHSLLPPENTETAVQLKIIEDRINTMLEDSKEGTERVISIIQNLLKFSRPVLSQEENLFDLNQTIDTSLIMMGNQLRYIAQVEKIYGDIPKAECRENEISHVIINLIDNAVHAMKSRKETGEQDYAPLMTIRTWSNEKSIFCEISNNGIPIPRKDLRFLFDPFFTTKKTGEGTGLGLSIAREIIIGRYEGTLTAESTDRTKFVFSLPIFNRRRSHLAVPPGENRKTDEHPR